MCRFGRGSILQSLQVQHFYCKWGFVWCEEACKKSHSQWCIGIDYQLLPSSDLPQTEEIDKYWGEISEMIDIFTNNLRFPFLSKIAKLCLVIPVANADSERMFSMMNKIVTEFRSELNNNTVSCLMCTKQNRDSDCYDFVPSKEVLQKAKKACVNYNNSLK